MHACMGGTVSAAHRSMRACMRMRAGQSVLEGLNALLDHRAQVFIPELGAAFACPPGFRLFAAQNPAGEGGGRRGLPRSFLSRFTRVHVEALGPADLDFISGARLFRRLPSRMTGPLGPPLCPATCIHGRSSGLVSECLRAFWAANKARPAYFVLCLAAGAFKVCAFCPKGSSPCAPRCEWQGRQFYHTRPLPICIAQAGVSPIS
jgi:hypothetical protein